MSQDPRQYVNLVDDPAAAGLLERMRGTLAQLRNCAGADVPRRIDDPGGV